MNEPAPVSVRDDGYRQDLASQWVASAVEAQPGERILDLCAAPGGKATAMAASGAYVVAADLQLHRANLIQWRARGRRRRGRAAVSEPAASTRC